MIAVIDETVITSATGLLYVVVAAVVIPSEQSARQVLAATTASRQRGFHWVREGPDRRNDMCEAAESLGATAIGFQQGCGRRSQDHARAQLLVPTLLWAEREGVRTTYIESRGRRLDIADRRVVKKMRAAGTTVDRVEWVTKKEPLVWLADALCGAYRDSCAEGPVDPHAIKMIEIAQLNVEYIPKRVEPRFPS
ncbi:MAG: hypothetical protein WCP28_18520 [Actinomycetes bacterium]